MDFKNLNDELEQYLENFQLNEMAIYYGNDHGTVNTIMDGFQKLNTTREGMVHVNQTLCVEKIVTQEEIDKGLFDSIKKNVPVTREYPIVLVWGEPNKRKGTKSLEGHGLVHILQGHGKDINKIKTELSKVIVGKKVAKPDRRGNYTISVGQYRFSFMLENNEDGTPKWAVLVTVFKRV